MGVPTKGRTRDAPTFHAVRYVDDSVPTSALARRAASVHVVLDGGGAADERLDRVGRVGAGGGDPGWVRAEHGAAVPEVAVEPADTPVAAVRGVARAGAGRVRG